MSLYRQVRRRNWPLVALTAVLALCIGVAIGLVVGGGSNQESLSSAVGRVQDKLAPAIDGLELLSIEYEQAVKDGKVVEPTEFDAANRDLERARQSYDSVASDLAALDSEANRRAGGSLGRLKTLVEDRAPPRRVKAAAQTASAALRQAARVDQAP